MEDIVLQKALLKVDNENDRKTSTNKYTKGKTCEAVRVGILILENMRRVFIIISLFFAVSSMFAQYVDLGLPSGTKWKSQNESKSYTFAYALRYYDGFLPTSGQFKELIENCTWKWTGKGYQVIGRNGKSICLSADFKRGDDYMGAFWSKTNDGTDGCYGLLCFPSGVKVDHTRDLDRERCVILCSMK